MIKQYKNDIYPMPLWILMGSDFPTLCKNYRLDDDAESRIDEGALAGSDALSIKCFNIHTLIRGCAIVLRDERIDNLASLLDFVSHECGHVTIHMCNFFDMKATPDNTEPYCYLQGYIARCIGDYLMKTQNYTLNINDEGKIQKA